MMSITGVGGRPHDSGRRCSTRAGIAVHSITDDSRLSPASVAVSLATAVPAANAAAAAFWRLTHRLQLALARRTAGLQWCAESR